MSDPLFLIHGIRNKKCFIYVRHDKSVTQLTDRNDIIRTNKHHRRKSHKLQDIAG